MLPANSGLRVPAHTPHLESDVRAGWVCGAGPDEPGFLLRRSKDSRGVTATFALYLAGVVRRAAHDAEAREESRGGDLLSLLLSGMDEGERLKVVYSSEPCGRVGPSFHIRVALTLRAHDAARVNEKVLRGCRELTSLLSALAEDYSFAPARRGDLHRALRREAWRARLRPQGFMLDAACRRRIGFTAGDGDGAARAGAWRTAALALPLPDGGTPDYEGIARFVAGYSGAIKVSMVFEPLRLSTEQVWSLRCAADALREGSARLARLASGVEEELLDAESRERLCRQLAQWAGVPEGYRMSCLVSAPEPPPATLVDYLRRKVFRGDDGRAERKGYAAASRRGLDLRGAVNRATHAPPPFPRGEFLSQLGLKRCFTDAPSGLSPDGILLGHVGTHTRRREVRFARGDRAHHSYVVGATGSGKSTLLLNMIAQDLRGGEGVALIDPHGDLYDAVLASVPPERADDLVLIDCCDFERAVGLNFLECRQPHRQQQINFISNEFIKIFDQLYDMEKTGGPVFEQYMRNALLLAMSDETRQATLLDIPMLFEDAGYRRALINGCSDPAVADFWSKQAERAGGDMALHNIAPYVTSKLNRFTSNALLRPMIGQAGSAFDFRELIDGRRILLVKLAKGILGEMDARLLGMLIMGKLFCAALGRADAAPASRPPFYLYVDEFQNFTTETVACMLSEARKYGLHLTLANQNLGQLSDPNGRRNVLDAVLGNCGSLFLFRQGTIDAQYTQAYTAPYLKAQDLQELHAYQVVARLLCQKRPLRPFVFQTLPPPDANRPATDLVALINNSKHKYSRSTSEIESVIFDRLRGGICV